MGTRRTYIKEHLHCSLKRLSCFCRYFAFIFNNTRKKKAFDCIVIAAILKYILWNAQIGVFEFNITDKKAK